MKFTYFNDTGRVVSIHPATFKRGCKGDKYPIQPFEERTFLLPKGTYPWIKMWDYGYRGGDLSILVSPKEDKDE